MTSLGHLHYVACAVLALIGLYGILGRPNLMRKLMGLNILQVSVILFYLLLAYKTGAAPPIGEHGAEFLAKDFINPLPHALMLTAIVVGVSVTGVGLAFLIMIHRRFGTLEEPEILEKLRSATLS